MEKESVYQKTEKAVEEALSQVPQQCKDGVLNTEVFVDNTQLEVKVEVDMYFKNGNFKTVAFKAKKLITDWAWVLSELADAALNYEVANDWSMPQHQFVDIL
jgi:hypothetical protein